MISYIFSIDQPVKIAHSNEKLAIDFIQIIGRNLKAIVDVFVIIYDFSLSQINKMKNYILKYKFGISNDTQG